MSTEAGRRRLSAIEDVCAIGRRCGLNVSGARVLRDANNTIVVLPEASTVGKVSTSTISWRGDALRAELAVGRHLAAAAAPIVPPLPGDLGGPHEIDGLTVTLWRFCVANPNPNHESRELGIALRALHTGLADFAESSPSFTERIDRAAALFADLTATPGLSATDRLLAARIYDRLTSLVAGRMDRSVLHGEPHSGNILWTPTGPLFIDFEAVCIGPVEWDLAHLSEEARVGYGEYDERLLSDLILAISFCVAAVCWAQPGRTPEVDEAARFHLDVLRQSS